MADKRDAVAVTIRGELKDRIDLSLKRLMEPLYSYDSAKGMSPDWPGDFYGRDMLALISLAKAERGDPTKSKEAMGRFMTLYDSLDNVLNEQGYFGPIPEDGHADEQQLAGNSWYLRALMAYYEGSGDPVALKRAKDVTDNLFIPASFLYKDYPAEEREKGEVSGSIIGANDVWKLSSDVGAAFLAFDGLSAAYIALGGEELKEAVGRIVSRFEEIDYVKAHFQTHATLTFTRGVFRLFKATGDKHYFELAEKTFRTYVKKGMTADYQNLNWFGRPETWTEPCCVVDSLILSKWFYEETKKESYLRLYRRILANALRTMQRDNGGAGCSSCATSLNGYEIKEAMYEAYFCCTMRLGEGFGEIASFALTKDGDRSFFMPAPADVSYEGPEGSFSIDADIYHHNAVKVSVRSLRKPFAISVALPPHAVNERGGVMTHVTFAIDKRGVYAKKAHLVPYVENGFRFVGDMLMSKKNGGRSYSKLSDSRDFSGDELIKTSQRLR